MDKNQRLVVLLLLLGLLAALFLFPLTAPQGTAEQNAVLFSSLFLLSFTALLLEHFYGRPTDVVAAGVSILLLIIPARSLLTSWGGWYWALVVYCIGAVLVATTALLLLSAERGPDALRNRSSAVLKSGVVGLASGKAQYFCLFFLSLVFFVEPRSIPFVSLLLYAGLVLVLEPSKVVTGLPSIARKQDAEVGSIFGVQGRSTFLVQLHPAPDRPPLRVGDLLELAYRMDEPDRIRRGIVLERFFLDQSQWIRVLCHDEIDKSAALIDRLPFHHPDAVYKLADRDSGDFLGSLVGVVQDGTNVRTLRFLQAGRAPVREGDLVQVEANDGPVLYQVVNATVDTESLEKKNEADFVVGEAVQLGRWDAKAGRFEPFGWVPAGRSPVVRAGILTPPNPSPAEVQLGCVPGTDFPVLLDIGEAISHHTAILGVTGVGKSVFARHLIRQSLSDDLRVIVVDFTREWAPRMGELGAKHMFTEEASKPLHQAIEILDREMAEFPNKRDKDVIKQQKVALYEGFQTALDEFLTGDDRIRVFELPDLSNTAGVLEYTQWFFKTLFRIARDSGCHGKRVCIVLEEAHTVIPEWNFIGLADKGSQSLVNNISQIALQGRKYGVGFIVIAQRTASVSKTVLTQCNTIIAFKCFDETSIGFLSHYMPSSVAAALPTLPFRRAIAVGKAIRGSVPLMFDVPELVESEAEELGVVEEGAEA